MVDAPDPDAPGGIAGRLVLQPGAGRIGGRVALFLVVELEAMPLRVAAAQRAAAAVVAVAPAVPQAGLDQGCGAALQRLRTAGAPRDDADARRFRRGQLQR